MIFPVYVFYVILVGLIRIYKWIELQVLKVFAPLLKRKGKEIAESIGVVLHCPGDKELGQAETEQILAKCPKYDNLLHFRISDNKFFTRLCNMGTLAAGELYMEGVTEAMSGNFEDCTEFTVRILENNLMRYYHNPLNRTLEWLELYAFNLQTRSRAFQVGQQHYDLGKI